jgi:hypothetical protein
MYTNGNFESHLAAMLFLGTMGLLLLLGVATLMTFVWRRGWVRYFLLAIPTVLAGYGLLLAAFSFTSYDRTVARGDEKYFCALDCHVAYSVQRMEKMKAIGNAAAGGEFYVVTLRSHFDERTAGPRRGNSPLTPDAPTLELVDASGRGLSISARGQKEWEAGHPQSHSLGDPLRPGESYETTWVFDVPENAQSLRLLAELRGFPSYLLIGDETSLGHGKTFFAL